MIELICIGCPKGCRLSVDENKDYAVSGHSCQIGVEYGRSEVLNPTRVLTTTVKIENAIHNSLPVKSSKPLAKDKLIEVVKALKDIKVKSPIKMNEVIVENILDTGIDIISTREM
ncbi:MAG: DUF1667 domain-containing protein [Bacillota bacterium]|jgi:CxxC motif-containing protein|nr:DUF1667 domain-containing protein [Bacillota bacterium]NLL26478.1 DUF1667 domain-containing protein [Erysipelotrichia bacterium]